MDRETIHTLVHSANQSESLETIQNTLDYVERTFGLRTAILFDVMTLEKDNTDAMPQMTRVGVVNGDKDWTEDMEDTDLDNSVFFFFDTLEEVEVGADMGDDTIIHIEGTPYGGVFFKN